MLPFESTVRQQTRLASNGDLIIAVARVTNIGVTIDFDNKQPPQTAKRYGGARKRPAQQTANETMRSLKRYLLREFATEKQYTLAALSPEHLVEKATSILRLSVRAQHLGIDAARPQITVLGVVGENLPSGVERFEDAFSDGLYRM